MSRCLSIPPPSAQTYTASRKGTRDSLCRLRATAAEPSTEAVTHRKPFRSFLAAGEATTAARAALAFNEGFHYGAESQSGAGEIRVNKREHRLRETMLDCIFRHFVQWGLGRAISNESTLSV